MRCILNWQQKDDRIFSQILRSYTILNDRKSILYTNHCCRKKCPWFYPEYSFSLVRILRWHIKSLCTCILICTFSTDDTYTIFSRLQFRFSIFFSQRIQFFIFMDIHRYCYWFTSQRYLLFLFWIFNNSIFFIFFKLERMYGIFTLHKYYMQVKVLSMLLKYI